MLDRKLLLGTTVIAGFAAALAIATPTVSFAQTTPPATTADDEDDTEVEALVVTGSRIKRSEFTSPAPIQVITAESSTLEGLVDTTEILQQSTLASGSFQVNNMLTGFVVDGGPGVNTISLRGLGATRTLVLLNGRRVGPAGVRGTVGPVDLNVIPNSSIERVEILKDGASSIYGSDAVAGVVNIITKSNLDGAELSAFYKAGEEQGGEYLRLNGVWGKTFDRGFVTVSADYSEQKALRRSDRDNLACSSDYLQNAATGARIDYLGLDGQPKCYNVINNVFDYPQFYGGFFQYRDPALAGVYPATPGLQPDPTRFGGGLAAQLIRSARANAGMPESYPYANYDSPYDQNRTVISPVKRSTLFGTFGYDITPGAELYGEFLYNRRESQQDSVRQLFPSVVANNPNNAVFATTGLTDRGIMRPIIAIPYSFAQEVDYTRGVIGLRGTFDGAFLNNWDWDLFYQFSRSDGEYTGDIVYNDRVRATTATALACDNTLITISNGLPGGNCSTLPAGGIPWYTSRVISGDFTAAERAFLFATETGTTTYDQDLVEGSISGDLFTLPAGPVGAAIGFQWRKESIDDTPGITSQTYNIWGLTSAGRTAGDDTIKEVFAEFAIPVAKGMPGIESLDLSLSGRYTDYASYGSNSTYKVGLNWQIVPAFRARATYGTSFRAPALYEQFLGDQTGFLGQTSVDPCIQWQNSTDPILQFNCGTNPAGPMLPAGYGGGTNGSALIYSGGGTGLKAEESKAYTLGVIWTPSFIDLSVAIDYFDISLTDQVTKFGAGNIVEQCYSRTSFPTNFFCTQFVRGGVGINFGITEVHDDYINIAEEKNRGIDLTLRYQHEFDLGRLTLDGQFTWQLATSTELQVGTGIDDFNGTTNGYDGPDFTGQLGARFDSGDWTFNWATDLIGKGSDTEPFGGDVFSSTRYQTNVYYKQYTEFTAYHDISVRRKFDTWTVVGGITNLFDERAPSASAGQFRLGTAALNQYDLVGRSLFVNVSKKW
ncbi:MAG: TonB-dependent receptor [Caulobacter sp.]|nr:TonB-dependent receptor [Caulobacter sp.]